MFQFCKGKSTPQQLLFYELSENICPVVEIQ